MRLNRDPKQLMEALAELAKAYATACEAAYAKDMDLANRCATEGDITKASDHEAAANKWLMNAARGYSWAATIAEDLLKPDPVDADPTLTTKAVANA